MVCVYLFVDECEAGVCTCMQDIDKPYLCTVEHTHTNKYTYSRHKQRNMNGSSTLKSNYSWHAVRVLEKVTCWNICCQLRSNNIVGIFSIHE